MKEDLRMTFFGLSSLLSVAHMLAYSSMRNEEFENKEFLVRKTDVKNEKMKYQKSSILEAFGGGNDRKFKKKFPIQPSQPYNGF